MPLTRRPLGFELLEARRMLAAQPLATLAAPDQVMIGESFDVTITFDNADATDTGYGPFIDLLAPVNGQDGSGGVGADGIHFSAASYLGANVVTTILTFPDDGGGAGSVDHPYAVDATGNPLSVTGPAGDQLIVIQLPFGSFTADQPTAEITVEMSLSNQADLNQPLNLRARAGFQFGNDPLDNPAVDPSLVSDASAVASAWSEVDAVEPILMELTKIYIGPEDETATGPNFPRQYTIHVDIADGQTVTDLDISDRLPNNLELLSVDAITPAGTTTTFPITPANAPHNELVVNLPTVTGSTAAVDASVTFTFFVPFRDADGALVIDSISGDDATSANHAAAIGDWDPLDVRDPGGIDNVSVDAAGDEHTLIPKSIATQKTVSVVSDPGANGLSPGDVLEYTIEIQISDYFGFDALVLTDVISDGQRFDTGFTPTLAFTEHGASTGVLALDGANFTVTDKFTGAPAPVAPIDGTQVIEVRLSDELVTRTGDGIALGGLIPDAGTGGSDPDAMTFDAGATTGTLVFRTIVQEEFTDDFPSGDSSVDEGDELVNNVSIVGDVLGFADVAPTGQVEADTSAASISVPVGALDKSIYALNGSTTLPVPLVLSPGDELTYRLTLTLPTSDVEQLSIEDFLPLPVLLATEVATFMDTVDASAPAAGQAKFGPADTFRGVYGSAPVLTTDGVSNSVTFDYGDFDTLGGGTAIVDLLFTVTATDDPFADGLQLTNQARSVQNTTNAGNFASDAIVQILLGEPDLQITKGIVATDNPNATFTTTPGPVTFTAPGTAGYRGSGTIHSSGLAASAIDANIEDVDAGDLVTFAVVLENVGSSRAGAFDIELRDTLPSGFVIPGGGLNLTVTDGTGDAMAFTTLGAGLFDPAGGISLDDPGPTAAQLDQSDAGALDAYDATSGRNVMVLTYDLEVASTAIPNQSIINTATLTNFASGEGGPDFTTVDLADTASTLIASVDVSKSLIDSNHVNTTGFDAAIGEILTYRAVIALPESNVGNVTWTDIPDSGLSVVDILSVTPSSVDVTLSSVTFADVLAAATISTNGDSISLTFPGLDNANRDDATAETIAIEYRAVVLNRAAVDRGDNLNNLATATWSLGADAASAPNVTVVEPALAIGKSIVPAIGQGTDQFLVTLDISHSGASDADAFNVTLTDSLPTGLTFVGSLAHTSGKAPSTLNETGGTIVATFNELLLAETSQVQFVMELDANVDAGSVITNTAISDWSSMPGDISAPQSTDPFSTERTGIPSDPTNDYIASANEAITVDSPAISKSLIATNQAHTANVDVAIGEIVTYRTTITVPQATLADAMLVDLPTAGLAIVDVLSLTSSPSLTASTGSDAAIAAAAVISADGSSITFDFGALTNSDTDSGVDETIVIEYRAIALNSATNDRGDSLDNQATFQWNTTREVDASAASLNIVEPEISIQVSNGTPSTADAGDVVQFVATLSHHANSDADAFDVSVNNQIDSIVNHLGYVPGSLVIASAGGAVLQSQDEAGGDLSVVWTEFPLGATATITFDVLIENSAPPLTDLHNSASVQWTGLPGDFTAAQSSNPTSVERTGDTADAGGAANDYQGSDDGIVTTTSPLASKTVVSTSLPESGAAEHAPLLPDVLITEEISFSIVASLPEGTSQIVITDQLPTGASGVIELLSATVTSVGANLTLAGGAPTIVLADSDADTRNDLATLDFGSVLNAPDGIANSDDQIEVTIVGRVVDTGANVNGMALTNTATIDFGAGQTIATVDVEVIEPSLQIDKTSAPATAPAGSTVDYTIVVSHDASSTADAFAVEVTDLLTDMNMSLVAGTVATSMGAIVTGNTDGDSTIVVDIGGLARGETVTITFQGALNPDLPAAVSVINTSQVAWNSLPAGAGRSGHDDDPATIATSSPEINLRITKDDDIDPVTVDESFTYTLNVVNDGPSTATDVTIVDTLPATVLVDNADVTASQGTSSLVGNTLTIALGTLRPGESAQVQILATAPGAEQTVTNQATVAANETDTDPTNNQVSEATEVVATASIAGVNWVDTDNNGIVDMGEVTLPGTQLTLTGTDYLGNSVSVSAVSGPDGEYLFDRLRPGDYVVTQIQPTLFVDNDEYVGSVGGALAGNDAIAVTLNAGDVGTDYNFSEAGLYPLAFGKRMLLRSSLLSNATTQEAIVDAVFASLVARGNGDLDGDLDVDDDDLTLLASQLGRAF